jgi:transcription initiation factor TFIID subunit 1, fungi type
MEVPNEKRDAQTDEDDRLIQSFLSGGFDLSGEAQGSILNLNRNLDPGEKADDAIDYEDISDDELPDEEPAHDAQPSHSGDDSKLPDLEPAGIDQLLGEEQGDGLDDLFGESLESNFGHGDLSASNVVDGLAWDENQNSGTRVSNH